MLPGLGSSLSKLGEKPSHVVFPRSQEPPPRPTPPHLTPPQEALLVGDAGPARQGPAG